MTATDPLTVCPGGLELEVVREEPSSRVNIKEDHKCTPAIPVHGGKAVEPSSLGYTASTETQECCLDSLTIWGHSDKVPPVTSK